jgi:hypothetical protein
MDVLGSLFLADEQFFGSGFALSEGIATQISLVIFQNEDKLCGTYPPRVPVGRAAPEPVSPPASSRADVLSRRREASGRAIRTIDVRYIMFVLVTMQTQMGWR